MMAVNVSTTTVVAAVPATVQSSIAKHLTATILQCTSGPDGRALFDSISIGDAVGLAPAPSGSFSAAGADRQAQQRLTSALGSNGLYDGKHAVMRILAGLCGLPILLDDDEEDEDEGDSAAAVGAGRGSGSGQVNGHASGAAATAGHHAPPKAQMNVNVNMEWEDECADVYGYARPDPTAGSPDPRDVRDGMASDEPPRSIFSEPQQKATWHVILDVVEDQLASISGFNYVVAAMAGTAALPAAASSSSASALAAASPGHSHGGAQAQAQAQQGQSSPFLGQIKVADIVTALRQRSLGGHAGQPAHGSVQSGNGGPAQAMAEGQPLERLTAAVSAFQHLHVLLAGIQQPRLLGQPCIEAARACGAVGMQLRDLAHGGAVVSDDDVRQFLIETQFPGTHAHRHGHGAAGHAHAGAGSSAPAVSIGSTAPSVSPAAAPAPAPAPSTTVLGRKRGRDEDDGGAGGNAGAGAAADSAGGPSNATAPAVGAFSPALPAYPSIGSGLMMTTASPSHGTAAGGQGAPSAPMVSQTSPGTSQPAAGAGAGHVNADDGIVGPPWLAPCPPRALLSNKPLARIALAVHRMRTMVQCVTVLVGKWEAVRAATDAAATSARHVASAVQAAMDAADRRTVQYATMASGAESSKGAIDGLLRQRAMEARAVQSGSQVASDYGGAPGGGPQQAMTSFGHTIVMTEAEVMSTILDLLNEDGHGADGPNHTGSSSSAGRAAAAVDDATALAAVISGDVHATDDLPLRQIMRLRGQQKGLATAASAWQAVAQAEVECLQLLLHVANNTAGMVSVARLRARASLQRGLLQAIVTLDSAAMELTAAVIERAVKETASRALARSDLKDFEGKLRQHVTVYGDSAPGIRAQLQAQLGEVGALLRASEEGDTAVSAWLTRLAEDSLCRLPLEVRQGLLARLMRLTSGADRATAVPDLQALGPRGTGSSSSSSVGRKSSPASSSKQAAAASAGHAPSSSSSALPDCGPGTCFDPNTIFAKLIQSRQAASSLLTSPSASGRGAAGAHTPAGARGSAGDGQGPQMPGPQFAMPSVQHMYLKTTVPALRVAELLVLCREAASRTLTDAVAQAQLEANGHGQTHGQGQQAVPPGVQAAVDALGKGPLDIARYQLDLLVAPLARGQARAGEAGAGASVSFGASPAGHIAGPSGMGHGASAASLPNTSLSLFDTHALLGPAEPIPARRPPYDQPPPQTAKDRIRASAGAGGGQGNGDETGSGDGGNVSWDPIALAAGRVGQARQTQGQVVRRHHNSGRADEAGDGGNVVRPADRHGSSAAQRGKRARHREDENQDDREDEHLDEASDDDNDDEDDEDMESAHDDSEDDDDDEEDEPHGKRPRGLKGVNRRASDGGSGCRLM